MKNRFVIQNSKKIFSNNCLYSISPVKLELSSKKGAAYINGLKNQIKIYFLNCNHIIYLIILFIIIIILSSTFLFGSKIRNAKFNEYIYNVKSTHKNKLTYASRSFLSGFIIIIIP